MKGGLTPQIRNPTRAKRSMTSKRSSDVLQSRLTSNNCEDKFEIVIKDATDNSGVHKYTLIINEENKSEGCKYRVYKDNENNKLNIENIDNKQERTCTRGNKKLNDFINTLIKGSHKTFDDREALQKFLQKHLDSCPLAVYAKVVRKLSPESSLSPRDALPDYALPDDALPPPLPPKQVTQVSESIGYVSSSAKKSTPRLTSTQDVIPTDAKIKGSLKELKEKFIKQFKEAVDGLNEILNNDIDTTIKNYNEEVEKETYNDKKKESAKKESAKLLLILLLTYREKIEKINKDLDMHYGAIQSSINKVTTFTELNQNIGYIVTNYLTPENIKVIGEISYILKLLVDKYKYKYMESKIKTRKLMETGAVLEYGIYMDFVQYLSKLSLLVKEFVKELSKVGSENEELNKNLEKVGDLLNMYNGSQRIFEDGIKTDIESLKTYLDTLECEVSRDRLLSGDDLKLDEDMENIINCFEDSNLSSDAEREMCDDLKKDAGIVGAIRGIVNNKKKTRKKIYNTVCKRTNKVRKSDNVKASYKTKAIMMGAPGTVTIFAKPPKNIKTRKSIPTQTTQTKKVKFITPPQTTQYTPKNIQTTKKGSNPSRKTRQTTKKGSNPSRKTRKNTKNLRTQLQNQFGDKKPILRKAVTRVRNLGKRVKEWFKRPSPAETTKVRPVVVQKTRNPYGEQLAAAAAAAAAKK